MSRMSGKAKRSSIGVLVRHNNINTSVFIKAMLQVFLRGLSGSATSSSCNASLLCLTMLTIENVRPCMSTTVPSRPMSPLSNHNTDSVFLQEESTVLPVR